MDGGCCGPHCWKVFSLPSHPPAHCRAQAREQAFHSGPRVPGTGHLGARGADDSPMLHPYAWDLELPGLLQPLVSLTLRFPQTRGYLPPATLFVSACPPPSHSAEPVHNNHSVLQHLLSACCESFLCTNLLSENPATRAPSCPHVSLAPETLCVHTYHQFLPDTFFIMEQV